MKESTATTAHKPQGHRKIRLLAHKSIYWINMNNKIGDKCNDSRFILTQKCDECIY